ncbi:MAG: DoxX family protein [Sphingobacterium siyangense]
MGISRLFCLCVIAIAVPQVPTKLKEWAYAGLTFNLIFAFISHACVDKNAAFMVMPILVLGILAVSYFYQAKITRLSNKETVGTGVYHQTSVV